MTVQKEWLDFLREQYPQGSRIRLIEMKDDPHPIAPGSMGTLKCIDDDAQFHIQWDNGSGLALRIGEDRFQVFRPEPQTLKFYMPLTAQLYAYDDWGDLEEYAFGHLYGKQEGISPEALMEECLHDVEQAAYHPHKELNRAIAQHLMQGDLQENLDAL